MRAAGEAMPIAESLRPDGLAAKVEEALGAALSRLEPLPGRSHSLNFRATAEDGRMFAVKLVPLRREVAIRRIVARSRTVADPLAAGPVIPEERIEFDGFRLLCAKWMDGERKSLDMLSDGELESLVLSHRRFLGTLRDDGMLEPEFDVGRNLEELLALDLPSGLRRELQEMTATVRDPARTMVIHGDLNPGNLLFRDGRVSAFLDLEEFRRGLPAEDLVRYAISSAEHLKFWQTRRRRRTVERFADMVRLAGFPAEDWTFAVNAFRLRRIRRHIGKDGRVSPFKRIKLRRGLYRAVLEMIDRAG